MSTYSFYGGEVELQFDEREHVYYREVNGVLVPQAGVTTVCHILDHSIYLLPWACKMMAVKIFRTMRRKGEGDDCYTLPMPWTEFVQLVDSAKKARTEHFEDAGDVGSAAHDWLQHTIQHAIDSNGGVVIVKTADI